MKRRSGLRWAVLTGMLALAAGCARPAQRDHGDLEATATIRTADPLVDTPWTGQDPCVGWRTGPSLVPVRLIERRSDGTLVMEGLWPFSPPSQQLPPGVATSLPLYSLRCEALIRDDGQELSVGAVNVLTAPAIAPTLTIVVATYSAARTATAGVWATLTAQAAAATVPVAALLPPVHPPLERVAVLCASPDSAPMVAIRLVDVQWNGSAWLLSFDGLRSLETPIDLIALGVAERCVVTLHPSGRHEVRRESFVSGHATPSKAGDRIPAPDLCAGYNQEPSLIPNHLEEIYFDSVDKGTWNLVLDGLWHLYGPLPPPTPYPTRPPWYQRVCHVHLSPDGSQGHGGNVVDILTAPAIGPTLTAAIATQAAARNTRSARDYADRHATWTAEASP